MRMKSGRAPDVFVSYALKDAATADAVTSYGQRHASYVLRTVASCRIPQTSVSLLLISRIVVLERLVLRECEGQEE